MSPRLRDRRASRAAGLALVAGGILGAVLSASVPLTGRSFIPALRPHADVYTQVSALWALLGMGCSLLFVSAGSLLRRGAEPVAAGAADAAAPPPTTRGGGGLLPALLVVTASGTVMFGAASRSLTWDEMTAVRTHFDEALARALVRGDTGSHRGANLVARATRFAFGPSERALRLGSLALTCGGLLVAVWAGRRWGGPGIATLWPALFLAFHGFVLTYAVQMRGYAAYMWLGLLLACAAAWAREAGATSVRSPALVTFAVFVAALGMGTSHLFAFLTLGLLTLTVHVSAWARGTNARLTALLAGLTLALGVSLLAWLPATPWLFYMTGAPRTVPTGAALAWQLPFLVVGQGAHPAGLPLLGVFVVAQVYVFAKRRALRPLALMAGVPPAAFVAAVFVARPAFVEARFVAACLPASAVCLAVALGDGLRRLPPRLARAVAPALVAGGVAVVLPGALEFLRADSGYREGSRAVAFALAAAGDEHSRAVLLEQPGITGYYVPVSLRFQGLPTTEEWHRRRAAGIVDALVTLDDVKPPQPTFLDRSWRQMAREIELPASGPQQPQMRAWLVGVPPRSDVTAAAR